VNLTQVIQKQRDFAFSGTAKPFAFRKETLKKLRDLLIHHKK